METQTMNRKPSDEYNASESFIQNKMFKNNYGTRNLSGDSN